MRRAGRIALWVLGILLLLPVLIVAGVLIALNTAPGQGFAAREVTSLSGGMVVLDGLGGRFPDRLRVHHLEVHDAKGTWLAADDLVLDWSPLALLHGQALVHRLEATRLDVARLPATTASTPAPATPSKPFALPVRVTVEQLAVGRADIGAPVMGTAAALTLAGRADLPTLETGTAMLTAKTLAEPPAGAGTYSLTAAVTAARIDAHLVVNEPEHGLIAQVAKLPAIGALHLDTTITGPRTALATTLALTAGPLAAHASGTIDLPGNRIASADITANAPAMQPAPGVSWQKIDLQAHVAGPFTAPDASGHLLVDQLAAGGAAVGQLVAQLSGNAGHATLGATASGVHIPGPKPDLLASAPLHLDATVQLDDPARPVHFTLTHPLLDVSGTARTAGDLVADVKLHVPALAPLAAIGGVQLDGHTDLVLHAAKAASTTALEAHGTIGITGGIAPAPALIGPDATIALSGQMTGSDITIQSLTLAGAALHLDASGTSKPAGIVVTAKAALSNLALLAPTLSGNATLEAHAHGPTNKLAVEAKVTGDVGAPGVPRGPVTLTANLTGLPSAPAGHIEAGGTLAGAPLQLAVDASRTPDGTLHATINKADWRSLHADGELTLPAGATLPLGHVALKMPHLDDLRPLIGKAITGGLDATIQLDRQAVTLDAQAHDAGIPGSRVGRLVVKARVTDPLKAPDVDATVEASGIAAAGVSGSGKLSARGHQGALALKANADVVASGTTAKIATQALLNVPGKTLRVSSLEVTASNPQVKPETVRLLAPATVSFGAGVAVDRLRLGVRQAVLDVAGKLSPRLDATVSLHTPADIAAAVSPSLALDGSIALDAKLTGTPAAPGGTVRLTATGIRARTGPGRAAPPADLHATAQLQGKSARIDARLVAGSAHLTVAGVAPLGAGALDLHATGGLDLKLLDPILTAAGRQVRGTLALDATVRGTAAAPAIAGSATLSRGELQDFTQGLHITALNGTIRAEGQTLRIVSLTGKAGPGTLAVHGTVGVLAPGLPVDLTVTMRDARPLASDVISADLDADITVRGRAAAAAGEAGALRVGGHVQIRRAALGIPSTLPASVVTLDVHRPGDKPPAPAAAPTAIGLDLTIDAPGQVFVRGRGVDAEMAGRLRIRGSSVSPQVSGGLDMRRGSIDVAGTTLSFSRGKVGFDGTGVTGKIDPTLDFVAESTAGGVTATLAIGGYVSDPKITLSSSPSLPQDEVLAYLIFKRSAKELGPFQIAEIAAGIAQLTGVAGTGGNPLDTVRKGLGLDRLSVGAGTAANSTPTLEAGRYVANGVYVGAKQGTTGGQTQATVQIDLLKGLKLETDVGSGTGGNQVGLTYQFQY